MTVADLQSWHQIARTSGFRDEAEMLRTLYETKGLSVRDIAKVIGFSYKSVLDRLKRYSIPLRGRGGANHISKG